MAWALVTGATGGIGQAFCRNYAARGMDVVLVARRTELLEKQAADLGAQYGVRTLVFGVDLVDPAARARLATDLAAQGVHVDTLVNNAGFGTIGPVADADPTRLNDEVSLNAQAVTHLTRLFLPAMLQMHRGTIINIASSAAFQPLATMAVYAASKAYVLSFSEAVHEEVRGSGVKVIAVCPGAIDTEFFENAGDNHVLRRRKTPQQVVDAAFRGLRLGLPSITDGVVSSVQARAASLLPRRLVLPLGRRAITPRH